MSKSSSYWDKRALNRLTEAEKLSDTYIKSIKRIYEQAYRNINRDIERTYRAYSKATGLDVDKLKELLSKKETDKVWKTLKRQGLDKYVKNNYKARISRLEQVQAQIYAKAKMIYPKEELKNTMCYKGVINNSYYKAIYDTQMGTGLDFAFTKIDNNLLNLVLNEKWSGLNYSQRIWKNTDYLAESLSYTLGGALLSGQSVEKTTKQIRERFNVSKYYAERLVRTETNHFNNRADAMAYEELGVEQYVFVATLDTRTSDICQSHDNKRYYYKDMKEGVNYPPLHPNCRSVTRGYISEEVEKSLTRIARNPVTGRNEIVGNISYQEWAKQNGISTKVKDTTPKPTNKPANKELNITYLDELSKVDSKLLSDNKAQLIKLSNKYPKISQHIDKNGLTIGSGYRKDTKAWAGSDFMGQYERQSIKLNYDYYKNYDNFVQEELDGIKSGWSMPCSEDNASVYTLTHEYGHFIHNNLLKSYVDTHQEEYFKVKESALKASSVSASLKKITNFENKIIKTYVDDIMKIAKEIDPSTTFARDLSRYGKSNYAEAFAEIFANSQCGKPNALGKAMNRYLEEVLK